MPKPGEYIPDEYPLRSSEFEIIRHYFPNLQVRYYNLLGSYRFVSYDNLKANILIRSIDNCLLVLPGMKKLARGCVMWAYK